MNTRQIPLPQHSSRLFLTDGGLETTLIFHDGYDLPYFAAFDLLRHQQGRDKLRRYYENYAAIAVRARTGFILESATWRASADWAQKLGYDEAQLAQANHDAIQLLHEVKTDFSTTDSPFVISGCIGPRGDGYQVEQCMSAEQARDYHQQQIDTLVDAGVDMISALTMTYAEEAIGIVLAAQQRRTPVVISFTTETDGRLPDGMSLEQAINTVDSATNGGPSYYMVNCAHPDHFRQALAQDQAWVKRIHGVRANASRMSHAELDAAEELDAGNPQELGGLYRNLRAQFPQFNVLGGCCGTDHRHVQAICHHCLH